MGRSLRPQRRPFVCPARSKAGAVAKELGPSSTFHAFSERGYNCALYSVAEWGERGGQDALIGQAGASEGTSVC